jgi:O-antigen ligase
VGLFLGLAMLKFGNPVILASQVKTPTEFWEWVVGAWPLPWAYASLALICVWGAILAIWYAPAAIGVSSAKGASSWLAWFPLAWFAWQCVSAAQTVSWPLTSSTLVHFAAATACFYLGFLVLARAPDLTPMWAGILAGFTGVIVVGFDQRFGGLELTRQFFYSQPDWQNHSPELLRKIASNRIYSTLFYPNTLAGVILIFLPFLITISLQSSGNRLKCALLGGSIAFGGVACLFWSGSKAGWLIGLTVALIAWSRSAINSRTKWIVGVGVTVIGLAVFLGRHTTYLEKGATSMGARFDYWSVAIQIAGRHPVLGTGPGTFQKLYRYLKSPESEMARLAHNDYLEQASDSGIVGFILFCLFTLGSVLVLGKCLGSCTDRVASSVWFGLVGWALQSFVEFGLYIPALAWPAFLFLGWLLARSRALTEFNPNPAVD